MVMRPLYDTMMMTFIYCEQMDSYYPTAKICGLTLKRKSRILRVFAFPTFRHNILCRCPTFKKMVTMPLYNTIMITNIYYAQIDPYYRTGKKFDYNLESET